MLDANQAEQSYETRDNKKILNKMFKALVKILNDQKDVQFV